MTYEHLTDEQLVALAQGKDDVAVTEIIVRYKNFVRAIIRKKNLFLPDGDTEDLLQEGMIGLIKAISTYDGASSQFKSYAYLCIERVLIDAIVKSNRGKNLALNSSVSLDAKISEGAQDSAFNTIENPETDYINKETSSELINAIQCALSKLENQILQYYLGGYSYEEISKKTGKNVKAIDNALQRIRTKIKGLITNK